MKLKLFPIVIMIIFLTTSVNGLMINDEEYATSGAYNTKYSSKWLMFDEDGAPNIISTFSYTSWDLLHMKLNDTGSWEQNEIINQPGHAFEPHLYQIDGDYHLIYRTYSNGLNDNIIYTKKGPEGWTDPVSLSNQSISREQDSHFSAEYNGEIHCVWRTRDGLKFGIGYSRYKDGSWSTIRELSDFDENSKWKPSIAIHDNVIFITWAEIFLIESQYSSQIRQVSFENGIWSNPENITSIGSAHYRSDTNLVANDLGFHLFWSEMENEDSKMQLHTMSWINGDWGPETILSEGFSYTDHQYPRCCGWEDKLFVVWVSSTDSNSDILFNFYGGYYWEETIEISTNELGSNQYAPCIGTDGYSTYVCWSNSETYHGASEIIYRRIDLHDPPRILNISVENGWDQDHVINHNPIINWTFDDPSMLTQTQFNLSLWRGIPDEGELIETTNISSDTTEWKYLGDELQDGFQYSISVQASNGKKWSDHEVFTFEMNLPPSKPSYPNYNGSKIDIGSSNSTILRWNAIDEEDGDTITYHVFGDFDIEYPATLISTSYEAPIYGLESNGEYFWRVCAFDGYEWSNGTVWSFYIDVNDDPFLDDQERNVKLNDTLYDVSFKIKYSDIDNDPPFNVTLVLNDVTYFLGSDEEAPINYSTGQNYSLKISLAHGTYDYYYLCFDEHGYSYKTDRISFELDIPESGIDHVNIIDYSQEIKKGETIQFGFTDTMNISRFTFEWDFSDEMNNQTGRNISKTFDTAGTIGFTIEVTDQFGRNVTINGSINVEEKTEDKDPSYLFLIPIILLFFIIISLIAFFIVRNKRKDGTSGSQEDEQFQHEGVTPDQIEDNPDTGPTF